MYKIALSFLFFSSCVLQAETNPLSTQSIETKFKISKVNNVSDKKIDITDKKGLKELVISNNSNCQDLYIIDTKKEINLDNLFIKHNYSLRNIYVIGINVKNIVIKRNQDFNKIKFKYGSITGTVTVKHNRKFKKISIDDKGNINKKTIKDNEHFESIESGVNANETQILSNKEFSSINLPNSKGRQEEKNNHHYGSITTKELVKEKEREITLGDGEGIDTVVSTDEGIKVNIVPISDEEKPLEPQ